MKTDMVRLKILIFWLNSGNHCKDQTLFNQGQVITRLSLRGGGNAARLRVAQQPIRLKSWPVVRLRVHWPASESRQDSGAPPK